MAVGGAFGSVGASPCCGELALAFFLNLGVTVLLACVAGLGIEEAAGAGMSVASSAWTVSGGELGTFGPSVPAGKGTGMLSILGVLGLGGMGGWSAGAAWLCGAIHVLHGVQQSFFGCLGTHGGNAT